MIAQRPMPRFAAPQGPRGIARLAPPRAPIVAQRLTPLARPMPMAQAGSRWLPASGPARFMAGLQPRLPMNMPRAAAYSHKPAPQTYSSVQGQTNGIQRPKLAAQDGNPWQRLHGG
jgi:hypothetical protein